MYNSNDPKTEEELQFWMKEHCFNFNEYSINDNAIHEGFGIDKSGESFIWYFTERGEKRPIKEFASESDIITYAYKEIQSDIWARTHCIGFTTNKEEKQELSGILKDRNIEFLEDEIPYYGPDRPVYRIFVLGCDIHKTADLKEKYMKES